MTVALRETNLKFGYCEAGRGRHFRQIFCQVHNKNICADCAKLLSISVIEPGLDQLQPQRAKKKKPAKKSNRASPIIIEKSGRSLSKSFSPLRAAILGALSIKCLTTKELYEIAGNEMNYDTFTNLLNRMTRAGIVICDRRGHNSPNFFALPANREMIEERIGEPSVEQLILNLLRFGPMSVPDIGRTLRKSKGTIHNGVKRLLQKNKIRRYEASVPGHTGKLRCYLCTLVE